MGPMKQLQGILKDAIRDLMKTFTKNFSGEGEGGLNKNAKSFSQDTDWHNQGSN